LGGSLKAEGFGDGEYRKRHPQAALEAAILPSYKIKFNRLIVGTFWYCGWVGKKGAGRWDM